jgi:hypothetical protein
MALATVAVPAIATTSSSMPTECYQGSVGYVTGGVGQRDARLFEQHLTSHPLAIELLEHSGKKDAFTADAMVRIVDPHGRTVLDAQADGPFMLVDLPPGRYSIHATLAGDTMRKTDVWISAGHTARATFEFPSGTDEAHRAAVASMDRESAPDHASWNAGLGG